MDDRYDEPGRTERKPKDSRRAMVCSSVTSSDACSLRRVIHGRKVGVRRAVTEMFDRPILVLHITEEDSIIFESKEY